jgi:hypothetical protein
MVTVARSIEISEKDKTNDWYLPCYESCATLSAVAVEHHVLSDDRIWICCE